MLALSKRSLLSSLILSRAHALSGGGLDAASLLEKRAARIGTLISNMHTARTWNRRCVPRESHTRETRFLLDFTSMDRSGRNQTTMVDQKQQGLTQLE